MQEKFFIGVFPLKTAADRGKIPTMTTQIDKKNSPRSPKRGGAVPTRSDERLDREAMALRENLRRRKEQARARNQPSLSTTQSADDGEP